MTIETLNKLVRITNEKTQIPIDALSKFEMIFNTKYHNEYNVVNSVLLVGRLNGNLFAVAAYVKGNTIIEGETYLQTFNLDAFGSTSEYLWFGRKRGFSDSDLTIAMERARINNIQL